MSAESELCEVVYSAEMAGPKPPTHGERIEALEKALGIYRKPTIKDWIAKNWGLVASLTIAALALVVAYFAWWQPQWKERADKEFVRRVDDQIDAKFEKHIDPQMKTLVDKIDSLGERFTRIEGQMDILRPIVEEQVKKTIDRARNLSPTELKQQLPQINEVLNAAAQEKIPANPGLINGLRDKLLPLVGRNDKEAWEVTVSLASYHTVFNENPFLGFAVTPIRQPTNGIAYYDPGAPPPGESLPIMKAVEAPATKETGALYAPIGVDLNKDVTSSNQAVELFGGGVVLDGHRIRNIVFNGVHVVYNGGSLILESAIFINCRFTIQQNPAGKQFVARSLDSERTTFTAS